jgi:DNA repair photolyase
MEERAMTDFKKKPMQLWGIFPSIQIPIEISLYGHCDGECFYCFARLNRLARKTPPHPQNPTREILARLSREMSRKHSLFGYFLRNGYPIAFSSTCDPFMRGEKTERASLAFLRWASEANQPLWIQTKGGILAEPEEWDRYEPFIRPRKDVVYLTITTLDDALAEKAEPGSPLPSERLILAEKLTAKGVPVIVGCNPSIKEWISDKAAYCEALANAGARGIFHQYLTFTQQQASLVPESWAEYREIARQGDSLPANFQDLKDWYLTARQYGLMFYPGFDTDAAMGYLTPFSTCIEASDFGPKARLFTATIDFMRMVQRVSHGGPAFTGDLQYRKGKKIVVQWRDIEAFFKKNGLDNPLLETKDFWRAFDIRQEADKRRWTNTLGQRARLYDILRYYWNNPHENAQVCWDNTLLQILKNFEEDKWIADEDGNVIGVYNPDIRMLPEPPEAYDVERFDSEVSSGEIVYL